MNTYRHPFILSLVAVLGGCGADADPSAIETSAEAQQSLVSTVVSASFTLNDLKTTIQTGEMPASWFNSESGFLPIFVTWQIPASNCRAAMGGVIAAENTGSVNAVGDPDGTLLGYSWSAEHSLKALENHWHNQLDCKVGSTVVGCSEPRPVSYTLMVSGACLLSTTSSCSASGTVSLPAVHDADTVHDNCTAVCDAAVDACASACETQCARGGYACIQCCECACNDKVHSDNPACAPPPLSCYIGKASHPACLPPPP